MIGLSAARSRGRLSGRPKTLNADKQQLAVQLYQAKKTSVKKYVRCLRSLSQPFTRTSEQTQNSVSEIKRLCTIVDDSNLLIAGTCINIVFLNHYETLLLMVLTFGFVGTSAQSTYKVNLQELKTFEGKYAYGENSTLQIAASPTDTALYQSCNVHL